jgi:membrane protein YqaA with SNARE-associated domain
LSVINISISSTLFLLSLDVGVFSAGLLRSAPLKYISRTICGSFFGVIIIYAIDVKQFSF